MVSAVPPRPTDAPRRALDAIAAMLGERAQRHAPFGTRTTYRVGGEAAVLVEATTEDDLVAVHRALLTTPDVVPLLVLGEGSNLLVSDAGFPGVVIRLATGFDWVEIEASTVRAGAGAKLPVVARKSAAAGLHGLEWGVGIPGSVGGALRMNAGGHGSDIAAVLARCRVFDIGHGGAADVDAPQLALGYRTSVLADGAVVVGAEFSLEPGDRSEAEQMVADIVRWRREHQPGGPNAGSVFKNPVGDSAGRLVEAAGLKGLRMGTAEVSTKHANFIQADRGGSADDVWRLVHHVRAEVLARTGIDLTPEVRAVGFDLDEPSTSTGGRGS